LLWIGKNSNNGFWCFCEKNFRNNVCRQLSPKYSIAELFIVLPSNSSLTKEKYLFDFSSA